MSSIEGPDASLEAEAPLLSRWIGAFSQAFGATPVLEAIGDGDAREQRLTVPLAAFQPPELAGGTGHFKHHPNMVAHVKRLGFDWAEGGRILTVPTPATFMARLARFGQPAAGYALTYRVEDRPVLALGPWLRRTIEGRWTVHVASDGYYAQGFASQALSGVLKFQVASMIHDLGVHALNYHLVPHARIAELAERIRTGVPERWASWADDEATIPLNLSYFYDNDVNRYCYAVWCRAATPEAFGPIFDRHFDQLVAALDRRLDETRRGLGDVKSGDTKDLPTQVPVEFQIR